MIDTVRSATVLSDCSAAWHVESGIVRVDILCTREGVVALGGTDLGKCVDAGMPRHLWDQIRYEAEQLRHEARR